jgi:hypothetical protein
VGTTSRETRRPYVTDSTGLPTAVVPVAIPGGTAGDACDGRPGDPGSVAAGMSTRRLIFAALVCGLAILVAFSLQLATAPR